MLEPSAEPGQETRLLRLVAERARELADADLVLVVLPDNDDRDVLRVEVAVGAAADRLSGHRVEAAASLAGHVLATGQPLRLTHAGQRPDPGGSEPWAAVDAGPMLVIPLVGSHHSKGVLTVVRLAGRPAFSSEDLDMAAGFANQASVAMELGEARAEQERARVLDERERIAADLHDHVIQRLFAAGLSVQSVAARLGPGPGAERLLTVVSDLDETIAQIRASIFSLQHADDADEGLRGQVLDIVTAATPGLGVTPVLRFSGPVDTLARTTPDDDVTEDVTAVVREALSNVARHARATHVEVEIVAGNGAITLVVRDDGIGIGRSTRRSGLANLRRRAERRGGTMSLAARDPGTELVWTVPVG
jgi:signal transduction histidine kinase